METMIAHSMCQLKDAIVNAIRPDNILANHLYLTCKKTVQEELRSIQSPIISVEPPLHHTPSRLNPILLIKCLATSCIRSATLTTTIPLKVVRKGFSNRLARRRLKEVR